ncbi:hypothetical protein [Novosphingobium sp. Leaf2]|uniref:hypothetical protein n=1 Tax=Novosphingobium sp. Leaf2 TaxID=1735670 RepID=UPI0012E1150F|nr:hypothetical protein [Novosphingobium sp. Leaf2]
MLVAPQVVHGGARDPERAATIYRTAVPASGYSHAEIVRIFRLLTLYVYGNAGSIGQFDLKTMRAAEAELIKRNLVQHSRPTSTFYTNALTHRNYVR